MLPKRPGTEGAERTSKFCTAVFRIRSIHLHNDMAWPKSKDFCSPWPLSPCALAAAVLVVSDDSHGVHLRESEDNRGVDLQARADRAVPEQNRNHRLGSLGCLGDHLHQARRPTPERTQVASAQEYRQAMGHQACQTL